MRNPGLESVRMPLLSLKATQRLSTAISIAMFSTAATRVVDEDKKEKGGRPAHWTSDKPVWFQCQGTGIVEFPDNKFEGEGARMLWVFARGLVGDLSSEV